MNQQPTQPMAPQGGSSKVLWIVLIIVLLATGGYFGWNYMSGSKTTTTTTATPVTTTTTPKTTTTTPTTTTTTVSTADWKTYTNEKYGYTLMYPSDFIVGADQGANASEPKRVSWVELTATKYANKAIVVEVLDNSYTDINAWVTAMNSNDAGIKYTTKDITIAGKSGKQLLTTAEGGAIRTGFINGSNLIIIHQIGTDSDLTLIYDKIISKLTVK